RRLLAPVALDPEPAAAPVPPVSLHPARVRPGTDLPAARHPDVGRPVPAVVAALPDVVARRRRPPSLDSNPGRPDPDVDRHRRNGADPRKRARRPAAGRRVRGFFISIPPLRVRRSGPDGTRYPSGRLITLLQRLCRVS